jgi:hypothetical protein
VIVVTVPIYPLQSVERIAQIAQQAVYEIKVAAERQATDWAKRFIASVLPINQKRKEQYC